VDRLEYVIETSLNFLRWIGPSTLLLVDAYMLLSHHENTHFPALNLASAKNLECSKPSIHPRQSVVHIWEVDYFVSPRLGG
jgi:hypothetical protein